MSGFLYSLYRLAIDNGVKYSRAKTTNKETWVFPNVELMDEFLSVCHDDTAWFDALPKHVKPKVFRKALKVQFF